MTTTTEQTGSPVKAIVLVLAAMGTFAVMDGTTKILSQTVPIPQILWFRNIVFTLMAVALLKRQSKGGSLLTLARSSNPLLQVFRAALLVVESALFMVAFKLMPLADVHAVAAAAPLMAVAMSVPFLGEKVGPRRWAAVLVGFVGVLLIIRPGFEKLEPPVLIVLLGAFLWAFYQILVRLCARSDRAETTMCYTAFVGLVATTLVGPAAWMWPDPTQWALLIAIAVMGSVGHMAFITALGMTETALLQPYTYSLFVWAVVVGYAMFHHLPDAWTLAGAAVIIASGLYVWHRERVRAAEK